MYRNLLLVGLGSCIGGISRYLLQSFIQRHYFSSFPLGTLLVNITGCFAIGLVYGLANKGNLLSPDTRLFLATGLCGGYTTFSSFAFENMFLINGREWMYFSIYLSASVLIGLGATYLGAFLIKAL